MSCKFSEERETKLAEFRGRIALLGEELEGLAESKLLKEESFLVRFCDYCDYLDCLDYLAAQGGVLPCQVFLFQLDTAGQQGPHYQQNLRFLRGSNWDVDIAAGLIAGSHRMIQVYILSY